ncbi:PREDICTED: neurogenic locus notch homolog protein 1-like [Acropora digitifera]|uniref:neurogenic locus notch homolog protein 1-like n=1 Tax=Acropora digitifera TaxID=70779 RepID=UPI00077AC832|nr:PREDICTED: neurogenic locus notch homolog protein 1-like [Acropora digitifera]
MDPIDISSENINSCDADPHVYLDKCTYFDQARVDQRFEVVNEISASICSKFDKNLAFKKSTAQSSTDSNGFSSRAVDENLGPYYSSKSCTHTKKETNPWWRVDLGREYIVTDVTIINRFDHYERLKNFDVRIGVNTNNLLNPTCSDRVTSVGQGAALQLQCDPPIPGRYVSVQMFGQGILSMCEVMVYSRVGSLADLCQLDNGGCEQVCYNLCNLQVKCGCWPGFNLAYDGITCVDRDECQVNYGGCDVVNGVCINTLGSYHCACKQGYELKENSETDCEDVDECTAALNNGDCEHTCSNYEGGYYCSCNVGYRLMEDFKSCEEIYCPALEAPFRGHITPETCTDKRENIRRNTVCTYGCESAHYISGGDPALECQINGFWNGITPYCKRKWCFAVVLKAKCLSKPELPNFKKVLQFAVSTGTKFGGATTGARYLERTILEASGNSEFLLSWMP